MEMVSHSLEVLKLTDQQIKQQSISLKGNHDQINELSIQQTQLVPQLNSNNELASKLNSVSLSQVYNNTSD